MTHSPTQELGPDQDLLTQSRTIAQWAESKRAVQGDEALERQNERLTVLGSLLTSVLHEINNPLAAATLSTDTAATLLATGSQHDGLQPCVTNALRALNRCTEAIQDLLRFARDEPCRLRPGNVNALVEQAVSLAHTIMSPCTIFIETDLASSLPIVALSAQDLQFAVYKLLNLAVHFQGVSRVRVGTECHSDEVRVRVIAHGERSIDEDGVRKLAARSLETKVSSPSGIVMDLVRRIVEEHSGRLIVATSPHGMISFDIHLPVMRQTLTDLR